MKSPMGSQWLRASEKLRDSFKRRRDKERLVRLLEQVELAALHAGREWGMQEMQAKLGKANLH